MIKSLLFPLIVVLPLAIFCQQKVEEIKPLPVSIRVGLLGPFEFFDGNVTGGVEYPLGPKASLTADIGAIFYSLYFSNNNRALGYIFRPGLRYYFTENRRGYMEGDLFYKRVGYQKTDWLERGVVNGISAYEEYRRFVFRKRVAGAQFLAGYKGKLNKQGTFWIEVNGGVSVRIKWQDIKNLPDAIYSRDLVFNQGISQAQSVYPGLQLALRLVIDLPAN